MAAAGLRAPMELLNYAITAIIAAVAGALTPVLIARYSKNKQERDSGLVSDYIKITDMTGAQLERKINQINKLEAEIEAIKASRAQRDVETQKERDELKVRIQSDLMETQSLRNDYAQAKKQIIKLEDLAIKLGEYVDKMKNAMQAANIDVPLNGELLDSVMRLKAARAERAQE
jgi:Spy/CpxP family protein refolding chaperone